MSEITDLTIKNGGWLARFDDGQEVFVTHEEVDYAGCAQDAAVKKYHPRPASPDVRDDQKIEDPYQDFVFLGIRASQYADCYETLVDAGDLDEDPLPEGRAGAGRRSYLNGSIVVASAVAAFHRQTMHAMPDVVFVDQNKDYVIVLTPRGSGHPEYARIDGLGVEIRLMFP